MKKLNLNKKVIATLNDPNKITGGDIYTYELFHGTCEGRTCEGHPLDISACTCAINLSDTCGGPNLTIIKCQN